MSRLPPLLLSLMCAFCSTLDAQPLSVLSLPALGGNNDAGPLALPPELNSEMGELPDILDQSSDADASGVLEGLEGLDTAAENTTLIDSDLPTGAELFSQLSLLDSRIAAFSVPAIMPVEERQLLGVRRAIADAFAELDILVAGGISQLTSADFEQLHVRMAPLLVHADTHEPSLKPLKGFLQGALAILSEGRAGSNPGQMLVDLQQQLAFIDEVASQISGEPTGMDALIARLGHMATGSFPGADAGNVQAAAGAAALQLTLMMDAGPADLDALHAALTLLDGALPPAP